MFLGIARRQVFAGWWIVAAVILIQAIGFGTSFWAFGAFINPLEETFGWSRAEVSGAIAMTTLIAGLSGPLVGKLTDAQGVRRVMLAGTIITIAGFLVLFSMSSLWQCYLGNTIIGIGRAGITGIPVNVLVGKWFVKKRVIALGIAWTGGPLGGVLLVPLATELIAAYGWQNTLLFLGALVAVIITPLAFWAIRNTPADLGLAPDGERVTTPVGSGSSSGGNLQAAEAAQEVAWTARLALTSQGFWYISLSFCLIYFSYSAVQQHLIPFLRTQGSSAPLAGGIVGASALLTVAGRLLAAYFASHYPVGRVLTVCILLQTMGLALVSFDGGSLLTISVFILLQSLAGGGISTLEPATIMERFGTRGLGVFLGMVDFIRTVGSTTGPIFAGYVFDTTRAYTPAFLAFAIAYLAAIALLPFARVSRATTMPTTSELRGP
jgi:MFS family permease